MLLQVRGLTKIYNRRKVVNGVDFEVDRGEIVGLLGQNGAGKTTAFRMTVGMIKPDAGIVYLLDEDVTDRPMYVRARMGMGYLSQSPSVFQRMTVQDNIMAILETMRYALRERKEILDGLIDEFGLTKVRTSKAYTLSGGERRRLEISRALCTNPALILLDEPFSGVDPIAVADIQTIIRSLRDKGIGILLTDHNVRDTLEVTDRSYIIDEGNILTSGTSHELVSDPQARQKYLGDKFDADDFAKAAAGRPGRNGGNGPAQPALPPNGQAEGPAGNGETRPDDA